MKSLSQYIYEHINVSKSTKAFTIIKPGFLEYVDEIYDKIKSEGFEMYDHTDSMKISAEQAEHLYQMHKDKDFYNDLCKYMCDGDVCLAIWGYDGDKDPIKCMDTIKDHFRDKYGKDDMRNVMHSSDSLDNVHRESKIFFG